VASEEHRSDGCAAAKVDAPRRRIVQLTLAGMVAPAASMVTATSPSAGPAVGDRLVEEDAEGAPKPLTPEDLKVGRPLLAFPFDGKTARHESRLNKIMLIRLADADLDGDARARAAGGVLAFSAICTHQACDVKTWVSKEKVAVCFCHSSKFRLIERGAVASGPATRPLPTLPLKLEGGQLVVAGGFSAAPGGHAG
jgi:Rieske Fe-S protein